MVSLILLVFAFVCAVLAAAGWPQQLTRPHLGWCAIAFWIASELFGHAAPLLR
jgi:hypothetical protein